MKTLFDRKDIREAMEKSLLRQLEDSKRTIEFIKCKNPMKIKFEPFVPLKKDTNK